MCLRMIPMYISICIASKYCYAILSCSFLWLELSLLWLTLSLSGTSQLVKMGIKCHSNFQ